MVGWLAQEGGPIEAVFGSSEKTALWVILGISIVLSLKPVRRVFRPLVQPRARWLFRPETSTATGTIVLPPEAMPPLDRPEAAPLPPSATDEAQRTDDTKRTD